MRIEHANKERQNGLFEDVQISILVDSERRKCPSSSAERWVMLIFRVLALSLTTPAYCKNFLSRQVRRRSNCVCLIASVLFICVTLTCSACLLHHSVEPTKHLCGHDQP